MVAQPDGLDPRKLLGELEVGSVGAEAGEERQCERQFDKGSGERDRPHGALVAQEGQHHQHHQRQHQQRGQDGKPDLVGRRDLTHGAPPSSSIDPFSTCSASTVSDGRIVWMNGPVPRPIQKISAVSTMTMLRSLVVRS